MPLKVCLIGAGHMGRIHARKLAGMRDVTLTCVVDRDEAAAAETAREHGVAWARDYASVLADGARAVVIASPTDTHYALARALLERGLHVFIEKPITASPAEARSLIALARANKLVMQVGHLERFSPPFRKARPAIGRPLLIEARRIGPFTGRSTDIDVVHDLMIHDIDLVLSLVKDEVTRIRATGTAVLTEKIDTAAARIQFAGGCVATLAASRVSRARERTFRVLDEERYFSLDLAAGRMEVVRKGLAGRREVTAYRAARQDPVHDELRAFVKAAAGKAHPPVDGEAGLRALVLADAVTAEIERSIGTDRG